MLPPHVSERHAPLPRLLARIPEHCEPDEVVGASRRRPSDSIRVEVDPVDITFHYPPELFQLLVEAVPRLCRSKQDLVLFFKEPVSAMRS